MLLNLPPWAFWSLMVAFVIGSVRLSNWLWAQERLEDERHAESERQVRPEGVVIEAAHRFQARRERNRGLIVFGTVRSTPDLLVTPQQAGREA